MKKLVVLVLFSSLLFSSEYLLKKGEKLLFGFKTKSGKIVILALGAKKSYLVYRFGKKNRVEFEYPKDKNNSFSKFTYYHYMRPSLGGTNAGLDLNDLHFSNKGYIYNLYDEYSDEDKSNHIGIKIFKNGKKIADIKALSKSKKGTLLNIDDLIFEGIPIKQEEDLNLPEE